MRKPRRGLLALAAAAGVVATLLIPAAAHADYYGYETNYVAISSGPTGDYLCVSHTGAEVCFTPNGDLIFVRDIKADGYAAVGEFIVAGTNPSRSGSCVNNLGVGNWGLCNKNFPEDKVIYFNGARYTKGNLVDRGYQQVWHT